MHILNEIADTVQIFVGTPQYSSKDDEFMGDLLWGDVRQEFLSFASRYRILSVYQDLEIMSSEDRFFLNLPTEKHLTRKTRPIDLGQFSPEDEYLKVLTREIESLRKPKNFDGYYDYYLAVLRSLNKKKFLKVYQDEPMLQTRFFFWMDRRRESKGCKLAVGTGC